MACPVRAQREEAYRAIADAFTDTIEEISDTGTYIEKKPSSGLADPWKKRAEGITIVYYRNI